MSLGASSTTLHRSRRLPLAVVAVFAFTSIAALAAPAPSLAFDPNSFDAASEAELIALTNRSRANAGLKVLKVDSKLTSIARWRSKDMIERDYFSPTIPGYGKVFIKLDDQGYCYPLGRREHSAGTRTPDEHATARHPPRCFLFSFRGPGANILWRIAGTPLGIRPPLGGPAVKNLCAGPSLPKKFG